MWLAYIDESGDDRTISSPSSTSQPVTAYGCVLLPDASLAQTTREFIRLKRKYFPGRVGRVWRLSDILVEVKGKDLRKIIRDGNRNERRHAITFLHDVLQLLEGNDAKIIGRVWVKAMGAPIKGLSITTFSIQAISTTFQNFLEARGEEGFVVVDSHSPRLNAAVSHSIFTQKFKATGDEYSRIVEMPTFGHSENHAGLQIVDLITSAVLVPIACFAYCSGYITNRVYVNPNYAALRTRFGLRVQRLQHRYVDVAGSWQGGIVVSDPAGGLHGGHLFR